MESYQRVLTRIFEKPEYHFHIRELARATELNANTISVVVERLFQENIVKKEKKKMVVEVYADVESESYKRKKQLFNLQQLYESGVVDFLIEFYARPKVLILLGSYLRGEDFSKSDIDIAVISEKKERPDLSSYEKKLKRGIHLLVFQPEETSKEFFMSLMNGLVLFGYLEGKTC